MLEVAGSTPANRSVYQARKAPKQKGYIMAKKRAKTYSVSGLIKVWSDVRVSADDLEAAVAEARELIWSDFVKVHGEHIDSDLRIIGVADTNWGE